MDGIMEIEAKMRESSNSPPFRLLGALSSIMSEMLPLT